MTEQILLAATELLNLKHISAARRIVEQSLDASAVLALIAEHYPPHAVAIYKRDLEIGMEVVCT